MNIDEDTSAWRGCPTPLEMYKHQCALLEDELIQTHAMLRKARANVAGLVQMNELLVTGKATTEAELKKALKNIARNNFENSELSKKVKSLELVAQQRDYLLRENQRLLMEGKPAAG
ncbi:hypothetical protein [Pseudomonas marginalis]|uniref:hypothetical protein n=1 Tax=Pseudomonas marginalis TaxID=298 RepID=UPI002A35B037|nr:hypothetical protein [Pseudomonas marginalis]WPN21787.1 hypothetical protein QMK57_20535 [Pseudomonas marginalis]